MLLATPVSEIGRSFDRQLADWRTRYADQPTREMVHLCLLALEREENVAIAYHHAVLSRRLAALPVPDSVRELFSQALIWVWKTEEMHAVYIRGALHRLGQPVLTARTSVRHVAGAVGGWTVSVQQHRRWRDAPLSRAAASALTAAGGLTGRVPKEVRRHLRYCSFRDFCRYNIDTEGTAWACWRRLTELAAQVPSLSGGQVDDFRRVADDEERHGRVFAILADALTDDDHLRGGLREDELAARIAAVGDSFLPHHRRSHDTARNPIGSEAPVFVIDGGMDATARERLHELLRGAGLLRVLRERARARGTCVPSLRVAVQTHVASGNAAAAAAHRGLLEELALALRHAGVSEIAVLKSGSAAGRWNGRDSTPSAHRETAGASASYSLVDCAADQVAHAYSRGLGQSTIARAWRDADVRIVYGAATPAAIASALGAVAGIGGHGDLRSPRQQADAETPIMMVLDDFPPHFCVLSSSERTGGRRNGRWRRARRPPLPLQLQLYASRDALALDRAAACQVGDVDRRTRRLRRAAEQWFGKSPAPDRAGPSAIRLSSPIGAP